MWQNLAILVLALLLASGVVSRLTRSNPSQPPDGPRAPEYTKGWTLTEAPATAPAPAPAAQAAAPSPAPAPSQPAAAPPSPAATVQQLDALWARSDWDGVISLLEAQQRAAAPIFSAAVLKEKLYAAQVNAGRTVLQSGNVERARQYFLRAIEVDPNRPEAPDAIRSTQ